RLSFVMDGVSRPGGAAPSLQDESGEPPFGAFLPLPFERLFPDERPFPPVDEAAEARLKRGALLIDVLSIKQKAGLKPQRVPRPQAGGDRPPLFSSFDQQAPQPFGVGGGGVQFESVLSGVPGAGEEDRPAAHLATGEGERLHLVQ